MHKIIHHTAPDYLIQLLPNAVSMNTHYNLRNSEDLQQFTFRTEKFKNSLFPDCVRKWNALETNIKDECSIASFKRMINETEKSSKLYYLGSRKLNIIHAQLRMECSNLSAHLYNLHVIDSPECACSNKIEDTAHFLLDCPLYFSQRLVLGNIVSKLAEFTIKTLLYGDDEVDYNDNVTIFLAVHDFIRDTERF